MKRLLFLLIFSASILEINAQPCREIVGYYPNWQWYDRGHLVNPLTIDYSKYTIINYSFFKPVDGGTIVSTDAWADENLLLGQHDWVNGGYLPNTSIIDLAHLANVKVLASIGGWTLSDSFPSIASQATYRAMFASQCTNLLRSYHFDGIDIDWEYPGFVEHNGSAADKSNFSLLMQSIRDSIDAYGSIVSEPMLLTGAFGASAQNMSNIEWNNISSTLDIINLMSYDFFGSWDPITNHNSPLYQPSQGEPSFNIDSSVARLINYGVPSSKINVGVAFYGRSFKTTGPPDLFASAAGTADNITFQSDDGTPLYYNILSNMSLFTEHWDVQAYVPYLTGNGSLNTFVSYDNERSIAEKGEYINSHNLRGAIIWEITGDYIETSPASGVILQTPLADTLNLVLCSTPTVISTFKNNELHIYIHENKLIIKGDHEAGMLTLYDLSGKNLFSIFIGEDISERDIKLNSPGIYFVSFIAKDYIYSDKLVKGY